MNYRDRLLPLLPQTPTRWKADAPANSPLRVVPIQQHEVRLPYHAKLSQCPHAIHWHKHAGETDHSRSVFLPFRFKDKIFADPGKERTSPSQNLGASTIDEIIFRLQPL